MFFFSKEDSSLFLERMAARDWIDEKLYNRSRSGNCTKVLVGNWKEEQVLEGDMLAKGIPIDTIRPVAENSKRFKGGFESSAYLLSAADPEQRIAESTTTQRRSFNSVSSDLSLQQRSALGVRSQIRQEEVVQQSKEDLIHTQQAREDRLYPGGITTTYRETVSHDVKPKRVVLGVQSSYLSDKPITLYTRNPVSGHQMTVHGMSPSCSVSAEHSKHTQFSNPKFVL